MKKKIWELQFLSLPSILKYCKKCGKKMAFICSEQFRVNAQRKHLDIWLIYKCSDCHTTWNAPIYSRISPQSLKPKQLDDFYRNDKILAERYAMNIDFLRGNGVEVSIPPYTVMGECFSTNEVIELEIRSKYHFPIKLSSLMRDKLHLSKKEYAQLISDERIKSIPKQDLQKCRLKNGIVLVFNYRVDKQLK